MFSLINLEIFNHFTGKYEAIIYKLCKDYIGISRTPNMTLKQFREYMGIRVSEYAEFKKLNARVISEPVHKINQSEVSDILVFPEFQREGRKVVGLYFRTQYKLQTSLPL
jgi:plasmid replication initiation protein